MLKKIILTFIAFISIVLVLYTNPNKTYAANTCSNKNLKPLLTFFDYKPENKDKITSITTLFPNITNFKISSVSNEKVNVSFDINWDVLARHTFWIRYDQGNSNANIQWKISDAQVEHIVDGSTIKSTKIQLTEAQQSRIKFSRDYNIDNKSHAFKVILKYEHTGQYCETNTLFFSREPGNRIRNDSFTTEKERSNVYLSTDKCTTLKGNIENEICRSVECMRKLYQNEAYWIKNRPGSFQQIFTDMTTGGFDIVDLTGDGQAELIKCKKNNEDLNKYIENYEVSGCTDTIIWEQTCKFNPNEGGDTHLDPRADENTPNSLKWLQKRLKVFEKAIENMPTQTPSSLNNCARDRCGNETQPWKTVCQGICLIAEGTMGIVEWAFSVLGAALSTESEDIKQPTLPTS